MHNKYKPLQYAYSLEKMAKHGVLSLMLLLFYCAMCKIILRKS